MTKQIINLTRLQLKNLYGINVFRFTKDKKEKKTKIALALAYLLIAIVCCGYVAGLTYGYIYMGMSQVIPAYLVMLSSMIIFVFSIFKAGSVIFQRNAYDILTSLPVSQTAVVVSRFIRMYVENMVLALVVMLPAMTIYGIFEKTGMAFYLIGFLVMLFIPLIPITLSVFLGAIITAIASRMKRKSLVSAGLSILLVLGIMWGTSRLTAVAEEFTIDMLKNLSEMLLGIIGSIYPPAIWLGNAMLTGNFGLCLLCVAGGLALLAIVVAIISVNYHWISRGLYSTSAKHNYQLETLKKETLLGALYKRELRRYFSSSIYVTNTIVGPIMALILSVSMLVVETEQLSMMLELPLNININGMIPFLMAGIYGMMPTTCSSISLEGKEWWIIKSLPVKTKDILDAKLLLNISLILPFFIVSEILLVIGLKPDVMELVWLLVIPVVMILFSSVFGMTMNLKMPVFNWENEVAVVKQSAAVAAGGLGGFGIILLSMIPVVVLPETYVNMYQLAVCMIVLGVTLLLYKKNNSVNLQAL